MAYGESTLQRAHRILEELELVAILHDYNPTFVGTLPLGIDVPGSDIDIICQVHEIAEFEKLVLKEFGHLMNFRIKKLRFTRLPSVVCQFEYKSFPIEIFGQPCPVERQHAFRHMQIEARLLAIGGEKARLAIRELKRSGLKTEPAFARYFGLAGDPYRRLLEIEPLSDHELRRLIRGGV